MSTFPPTTSVFNDGYIAEAYEAYRRDPASVDESWRQFFRTRRSARRASPAAPAAPRDPALPSQGRRRRGARATRSASTATSPCSSIRSARRRRARAELTPEFHGITEADLADVPARALGFDVGHGGRRRRARCASVYSATIGFEFAHLGDEDGARSGSAQRSSTSELTRPLTPTRRARVLRRLTEVDGLERFLGRAYLGIQALLDRGDRRARADARRRDRRGGARRARAKS